MRWLRRCIFFLLIATAVVFLARDWGAQAAPVPADFVTVRYWEKWTGTEGRQMQQIVEDFNKTVGREKHIYVEYMSIANVDQKTLVAIAAGVPPDVAGLWDQQVAQYAALGAVEPIDDLARSHDITEQTYVPVYWNGCHYKGRLYALVSTPAAIALHYNKAVFRERADALRTAGCDPARPPRTLDELDRYAAAIDTRDSGGHIDVAGYIPLQSWYVPFTPFWFGGELFDPTSGKFDLDGPATVNCFKWVQSYSKRLGSAAVQDFTTTHLLDNFDSPQNPFLTGKLAMQQQGPWMANYIAHLRPSMSQVLVPHEREKELPRRTDNYDWAVAPFPAAVAGREMTSFCPFDALMIPVGARHKAEAFEFMAYVNRQDVCEKLNTLHCKNTQLRHVSESFYPDHPNPYIRVFQELAASPNARGCPQVPIWPEVYKELTDASQAVALQDVDPEVRLHAAQKRLQEQYDHFREIEEQRDRAALNDRQPSP